MPAVITLTTDFGLADAYVAAVKGVILGINPAATLVDISHETGPQDIRRAAFVLANAYPYFPAGTIHLAVVDPGVGTARRALILKTPQAGFVAPDNGILSYVLHEQTGTEEHQGRAVLSPGSGLKAVAITEPRFWRHPVSSTFHGRDIFAPVAAYLSLGVPLGDFGPEVQDLALFHIPVPRRAADGSLLGIVLHIDVFGNVVTNIKRQDLPGDTASLEVSIGGEVIRGLDRAYAEGSGLMALIGSGGRLEISLPGGSAADRLHARTGDEIRAATQIK